MQVEGRELRACRKRADVRHLVAAAQVQGRERAAGANRADVSHLSASMLVAIET